MIYSLEHFGKDLKKKIIEGKTREEIGSWAYKIYLEYINTSDSYFNSILMSLFFMEMGPDFYFSYEALNKLADDLIAGKRVSENLDEYNDL